MQLKGLKRRERRAQRRPGGGLTTSEEDNSDSAFPARTPENIKALDDLLEEEVPVPGDSGRGSIYPGHPGWAFLGKLFSCEMMKIFGELYRRAATAGGGGGLAEDGGGGPEDGRPVPGDLGPDSPRPDGEAEGEECEVSHLQTRQSVCRVSVVGVVRFD